MSATVCFVGSADHPEMTDDDRLALPPLAAAGVEVEYLPWDAPGVDWAGFGAVVVRTTWDYYRRIEEFLAWIEAREEDGTNLWNPARVLSWNADKRYLETFERAGVRVVPTEWLGAGRGGDLPALLRDNGWTRAVVKPRVSAGGYRTFVVQAGEAANEEVAALLAEADVMIQPFLDQVVEEGEWSLVFLGGAFSHSVIKRAAPGEFRVQPRHGGTLVEANAGPGLVGAAEEILRLVDDDLLYARVDGVLLDGAFTLIELEVLEPVLFLGRDPAAPGRFAEAIVERLRPPGGATPSSSRASR